MVLPGPVPQLSRTGCAIAPPDPSHARCGCPRFSCSAAAEQDWMAPSRLWIPRTLAAAGEFFFSHPPPQNFLFRFLKTPWPGRMGEGDSESKTRGADCADGSCSHWLPSPVGGRAASFLCYGDGAWRTGCGRGVPRRGPSECGGRGAAGATQLLPRQRRRRQRWRWQQRRWQRRQQPPGREAYIATRLGGWRWPLSRRGAAGARW